MIKFIAFVLLSIPVLWISWKSLRKKENHGFYRFFSWEAILFLFVFKIEFWFISPFSFHQIVSWFLLFVSLWFVLAGIFELKKKGNPTNNRNNPELFNFEKSSTLVKTGIFKYIRHPMYSSLLLLSWGIFFKKPDWILLFAVISANVFLFLTAKAEEKECIDYFGKAYAEYKKETKRFIPFIF